jgi:hypothetical protein
MEIFKNGEKKFEDKIDLCHRPKKSKDIMIIGMAAFSVPLFCPVVSEFVSQVKLIKSRNYDLRKFLKNL